MDWLETWRDSWSTGSATASSSSSSSAGGGNDHDDTRTAATDNAAGGKKRKQELATAATPSDEPRRTKRARKPTAALAEFRIELDSRQDRNDANDFEQPRVTRKRVRVESVEDAASSLQLRKRGGNILWSSEEDARLRTAVLTFTGKHSATTNNTSGRTKVTVKPVEWPEVKRIFDGLAPPVPGGTPAPSRSERSLQHRFDAVLSPLYQHAAPLTAPVAEAPSSRGSQWLVSPAPSLDASSATPAATNADAVSQHADRSATLPAEIERRRTKANASTGLGDGSGFGTGESGNGTQQGEDTTAGALKPQQQRRKDLWSPAEDARLRTALFTFAGLDPTTTSIKIDRVKVKTVEWHEVKRIFDALAPPKSASSGPPPPRSVHSLQAHSHTVLLSPRRQQAPPVPVPAEAGPSPSGSQWVVSSTPSSSAAAIPSGFAGTNVVEEDSQRADLLAMDPDPDERREESAPPNQAATVASFDSAASAAFFPESDDAMSGSLALEDVLGAFATAGSATAPGIMPSQEDRAAAPVGKLDSSTPRPEGSNTSHHQAESQLLSGPTRDVQGPADAEKGASIGKPAEPTNPSSEASGTPEAGTSGPAATSFTPPGNVNSTSSAPAGSGAQPAGSGGKTSGPFTAAEDARIIELFSLGVAQAQIARTLNRSSRSVYSRVASLRQRGMISQPLPAASPAPPPPKQPAVGASVPSTDPSPSAVTKDAQQAVAGSSHSTMIPASSSSMVVPGSQALVDNPQVGPSSSKPNPAAPKNGPDKKATAPKRFSAEEDQQIVELRASGIDWQMIGSRLQRTKASCAQRYARLKEKAQLAGKDLSSFAQPPKATAAGGQAGEASTAPPPTIATPVQQPAAATTPLPPYTVEDDTIILRMYLQGNSAERIGIGIKRSAFSVHRRWTKKKDGWIAAGLLTTGSRLKLHDDPPDQPVVSATTESPVDPFGDLRAPSTSATSVRQDAHEPIGSSASYTPTLEPETTENDLDGFDASFFSYEDMVVDPALLGIRAEPMSGAEGEATHLQPQNPAGSRQESPLVPSASEYHASTPEMATERTLVAAMPHYDSGMRGLDRFLRLVKDGGKKKR